MSKPITTSTPRRALKTTCPWATLTFSLLLSLCTLHCKLPDHGAGKIGPIKQWGVSVGDRVQSTPAVAPNGNIYVGSSDQHLYAFSPQGKQLWRYKAEGIVLSPSIGPNGEVIFTTGDGFLVALTPGGDFKWKRHPRQKLAGCPPAISENGTIITSGDLVLVAYSLKEGKPVVLGKKLPLVHTCIALRQKNRFYFGDNKHLYAWDLEKGKQWTVKIDALFRGPSFDSKGNLYLGTRDARLISITPKGKIRWQTQLPKMLHEDPKDPPALFKPYIGPKGNIYAVRYQEGLYSFKPNGKKRWLVKQDLKPFSGHLSIAKDGMIYLGTHDHFVMAITPKGKLHYRFMTQRRVLFGGAFSADQKSFYIGSFDGHLYAFHTHKKSTP